MHTESTWFVVRHTNNEFSVQDKPQGGGTLLEVPFEATSKHETELVCSAANAATALAKP